MMRITSAVVASGALGSLLVIALANPASGQTAFSRRPFAKGTVAASGGFSFSSSGGDLFGVQGERSTQFSFNPSLAYFLTSRIALGAQASVTYTSRGQESRTALGIGPQVGVYLHKEEASGQVRLRRGTIIPNLSAGIRFNTGSGSSTTQWGNSEYRSRGATLEFGAGLLFMLSEGYGVFFRDSYEFVTDSRSGTSTTGNRVVVSGGLTVFGY